MRLIDRAVGKLIGMMRQTCRGEEVPSKLAYKQLIISHNKNLTKFDLISRIESVTQASQGEAANRGNPIR